MMLAHRSGVFNGHNGHAFKNTVYAGPYRASPILYPHLARGSGGEITGTILMMDLE